MKLYVYDHCPYCIRARMPFGLKGVPFTLVVLDNDDVATPTGMIGRKMLPILEDDDGCMGESLEIVRKVDALGGEPMFGDEPAAAITAWLAQWSGVIRELVVPRTPDPVFPEFRTQSARDFFTAQKQEMVGDFGELLARTGELTAQMEQGLAELAAFLPDPARPGIDDVLLFPFLRSLTNVAELTMPPAVRAYCEAMAERCGVPLVDALRDAIRSPARSSLG